ncbi:endo alpha-1,4 polygalactosaminidase [soil metagenome]
MKRAAAVLAALLLAGCASPGPSAFPSGAVADYQLGGAYPPPPGVTVVARDSLEEPAEGIYSICYLNGFQTQPGADWPDDLVLVDDSGERLVDPNWPDENIIDISSREKRVRAASRLYDGIDLCAAKGFDAVEFDNLDSFSRSDGQLTLDDAVQYATLLTAHAHGAGLAAAQKNTGELGVRGRDEIGFDFAVVEECDQFDECGTFTEVYGERVIDIEYTDELRRPFEEVCAAASTPATTILRDRDLTPLGSPDYVYERC